MLFSNRGNFAERLVFAVAINHDTPRSNLSTNTKNIEQGSSTFLLLSNTSCFDLCVCTCQAVSLTVTQARAPENFLLCECVYIHYSMQLCVCLLSVCVNEEVLGEGLDRDAGMWRTAANCYRKEGV